MIYGAKFITDKGEKHTYNDWNLLQVGAARVSPPVPQTRTQIVPGRDGVIDLTQSLDGFVHYEPATFTGVYRCIARRKDWDGVISEILNFLQGRSAKLYLDDTEKGHWEGRFTIESIEYGKAKFDVTITGIVDPYKYMENGTDGEWLLDDFDFETDYAWGFDDLVIDGEQEIEICASKLPITPTFDCTGSIYATYNGTTYALPEGKSVIPTLRLADEKKTVTLSGNGTVSIIFRGGTL